ncbi:MAG TPA: hypothetical protein VG222_09085 [Vicinamibacterales bacterium]|jgi:hypothetical protein|nr:hypothetical protein [Vicinamibacterales bacterium]
MPHTLRRCFVGAALIAFVPSTAAILIAVGQREHPAKGDIVNYGRSIGPAKSH